MVMAGTVTDMAMAAVVMGSAGVPGGSLPGFQVVVARK